MIESTFSTRLAFTPGVLAWFLTLWAVAGQDKVFDNHVHIWEGEKSVKEYLRQVEENGQTVTRFGGIHMARAGDPEETRRKNDELISLSEKYPQLLPTCSVHPYDGEAALEELERLAGLGVRVIKLHPHSGSMDFDVTDDRVSTLCKKAGELEIAILMDNASIVPGDCQKLLDLAVRCPDTDFIFAHMGATDFRFWSILPLIRTADEFFMDNIHFDISGTVILLADSPLEEEFIWTLRNVGIDRILLGSDYPQLSLEKAIQALEKLDLTPEEKEQIRFTNAERLLFPPTD